MKSRFFVVTMLGMLVFLLCSTALACPNPDPCPGTTYDIEYATEGYHLLVCTECGYKTVYSHFGGQVTCTQRAICEGCGHEYGDNPIGHHTWGEYTPDGNATCTADGTKTAKCTNCSEIDRIADEGSALGHSFTNYTSNGNATCTADGTKTASCDHGCGETDTIADEGSALGHSFTNYTSNGNATCTLDGTKTAQCDHGCGETDTIADEGSALGHSFTNYTSNGDATCTADGTKTASCDRDCGTTDTVADEGSALGHDYKAAVTAPTCTKGGYTTYTCTRCSDSYTANKTAAQLHWYGLWSFDGDVNHSATCLRDGCGDVSTKNCIPYTVTVDDNLFSICPVCGNLNGTTMGVLKATATNADKDVIGLPGRGELIVRGLETPFDGVLYALTVAHEYAGALDEFNGTVHVEVSLALTDELPEFRLVRVDVAEAGQDSKLTETWTEIECNYEDDVLSFDTDVAGVFLLLPVE